MEVQRIMDESWDFLLVLDAARYDFFVKVNDIEGHLEKRRSLATCTIDWLKRNFTEYYENVIYISANPFCDHTDKCKKGFVGGKHFPWIAELFTSAWDEELKTIPPQQVNATVLAALDKFPDKRQIIHYFQPHIPYIGEPKLIVTAQELEAGRKDRTKYSDQHHVLLRLRQELEVGRKDGTISEELHRRAYTGNLKCVLDHVKQLLPHLKGKIVITSDHGEFLGEYGKYGHHCEYFVPELFEVPWLVVA